MRDDRAFRHEKTPVRLKDRDDVAGQVISRKPCRELSGVEHIAREPEVRARFERTGDWPAACGAGVDAAPDDEQLFAGVAFQPPAGPLPSDKPTVLKGLASSFDHCAAIADKLTPAQLDASYPVDWVGMPAATGRQILSAMFTHTAHHRGQAEVYLRLKGIVPPKYRY